VEWLSPLVEMTSLGKLEADTAQANALPGLGACPTQTLGKSHGLGMEFGVRFPALALAILCPLAISGGFAWVMVFVGFKILKRVGAWPRQSK